VAGVVDEHIDAVALGHDLADCSVHRILRKYVQLDGPQTDPVLLREGGDPGDLRSVPLGGLAHGGVHGVARLGEGLGGQAAEAAGRAGDEYDLAHEVFPSDSSARREVRAQSVFGFR
jgi:hypothetical protein